MGMWTSGWAVWMLIPCQAVFFCMEWVARISRSELSTARPHCQLYVCGTSSNDGGQLSSRLATTACATMTPINSMLYSGIGRMEAGWRSFKPRWRRLQHARVTIHRDIMKAKQKMTAAEHPKYGHADIRSQLAQDHDAHPAMAEKRCCHSRG